jgi:periplasmic copper chaperone A
MPGLDVRLWPTVDPLWLKVATGAHAMAPLHRDPKLMLVVSIAIASALATFDFPVAAHEAQAGDLTIEHPHARATVAVQKNGAAYMVIRNRGSEPDRLLGARTGEAQAAELHGTTVTAEGVARMRRAEAVEIPPGSEARLAPGGLHLMLVGLKTPLVEGTSFPMTLVFERGGEVEVEVMVEGLRGGGGDGGGQESHGGGHGAGSGP